MSRDAARARQRLQMTVRAILTGALTIVLFGLPLFLPAGSLWFWNAWLFLGVFVVGMVSMLIYFVFANPKYAEKRFQAREQEKPQRVVMSLLVVCALAMMATAGFNYRYSWSKLPDVWAAIAASIMAGALFFVFVGMEENSYASRVVEIQQDQELIQTGTYSVVRHPMYLGFSVLFCASPIVLGSLYSLIPAACIPFLLTFRIRNEERVLRKGLAGYDAYTQKVRYRLVPFVW